jgi:TusA-related sulfurtransferase
VRAELDLRGVRCPLSWAKARVWLETRTRGEEVDLRLDDPQGARDLPRAAESCGHHVVDVLDVGGSWIVRLEV